MDTLPTLPLSLRTALLNGIAAVAGLRSGSEFQLSTITLPPEKVMLSLATSPLAKREPRMSPTRSHFSTGGIVGEASVARTTIYGVFEPV